MATTIKEDAGGGVNPKPAPKAGARRLKKRAYEFKLARVREAGGSRKIESPEEAFEYWKSTVATSEWFQETKEHLVVLLLNTRHHIEGHNLVSVGTINETLAHPGEILSPVLCGAAYAFVLMHNHPSGDPAPSRADRELTRRIREGAELLQIKFLDHVIAGHASAGVAEPYFSFKEMGLL